MSFDVTSLFTRFPTDKALKVIQKRLKVDTTLEHRTNLSIDQLLEDTKFCLDSTYFVYKGQFYKQKHGRPTAMGLPLSPIVANLYMEDFEIKGLESFSQIKVSCGLDMYM